MKLVILLFPILWHLSIGQSSREKKFLSLFNLVQFDNNACQSSNSQQSGICYTREECASFNGRFGGSCASGFGVCCIFLQSSCGSIISVNQSYISNPFYPLPYTLSEPCSFQISRAKTEICSMKLDFETFSISGPLRSDELDGGLCSIDSFRIIGLASASHFTPIICGENSGQHVYVDSEPSIPGDLSLSFTFTGRALRRWQIKVNFIDCFSDQRPPPGCLQYHMTESGRLKTFNFDAQQISTHLANQEYNICIRKLPGFCCINYEPCFDEESPVSLSSRAFSQVDNACIEDYIIIEGSSNSCQEKQIITNKYCERVLNAVRGQVRNARICDCTAPYAVGIITNSGQSIMPTPMHDRGLCLDFNQIAC